MQVQMGTEVSLRQFLHECGPRRVWQSLLHRLLPASLPLPSSASAKDVWETPVLSLLPTSRFILDSLLH